MNISGIFRPGDLAAPDTATANDLAALFDYLRPGEAAPEIDAGHTGLAVAAHNPALALLLAKLSRLLALDTIAGRRPDLRELVLQAINARTGSAFSFEVRRAAALAAGLAPAQLAALPDPASPLFDDEQRLVLAYVAALGAGPVAAKLVEAMKARFDERGLVELTALAGVWTMWAMLLNAADPAVPGASDAPPA